MKGASPKCRLNRGIVGIVEVIGCCISPLMPVHVTFFPIYQDAKCGIQIAGCQHVTSKLRDLQGHLLMSAFKALIPQGRAALA